MDPLRERGGGATEARLLCLLLALLTTLLSDVTRCPCYYCCS